MRNTLSRERLSPLVRGWPVQLALLLVVALMAVMVGADLVIARRVAARTGEMVENTQRSVELLEDLHTEVFALSRDPSPDELASIKARFTALSSEYDKLASEEGERLQWQRLHTAIVEMVAQASAGDPLRERSEEIDRRVDSLIAINRAAAHAHAEEIRVAHRQAIIADGSVGAVVLALCLAVAFVVRRMLQRQRELVDVHIALLDERNRELDLFAGRAAHDMRAPLSPIRGYADLLATGAESPDEVQQMASRIRTAVDKMARVVDDMLELSRAGRPTAGRASPIAAVPEVLEELAAELRNVTVTSDVVAEAVACAPGVLQQILRNLIQNAVKFRSRERPLTIHISARLRGEHAATVELMVADNGVGMDAELAANAFQPYYRGRTDREVPGHGLGLAIVHRAAEALGGDLRIESAPDAGCRIFIRLPVAEPEPV